MSRKTLAGALALLALLASVATAAPPLPLDLVPEEACIGIAIKDLVDLRAKSEKLLKDRHDVPRFSQFFDIAFKEAKLGWPVDERKPAALLCTAGKLAGYAADANPENDFQVGAILPYRDLADVARAWSLKPEDLKDGAVHKVPGREWGSQFGLTRTAVRDGYVYLTGREQATAAWLKAKSLRQALPAARVAALDNADGLVYLGPTLARLGLRHMDADWVPSGLTEREAENFRRVNRAVQETRHLLAAYRLAEDGLGLDLGVGFDPKGKNSQEVLKILSPEGRTANLAGLPDAPGLVGALAMIGVDDLNVELARALVSEFWLGLRHYPNLLPSDAYHLRRILGDLYGRLKLGRGALYLPADPERAGKLALVAVLEPRNAEAFVKEVAQMARVADLKEFDPMAEAGQTEIARLVGDLGSDDFDTREAASTRLGLIGAPALAALARAEKSDDAEVRKRAGELKRQIEAVAELRKEELAKGLLKQAFHPVFGWKADAEKRGGVAVSHLLYRFEAEDAPYTPLLKNLFGPDWNRIRIARVGDKLVALLGSDVGLFDQAVQNVRDGKPGLEASPALAAFHKQAAGSRRAELHLALARVQALTTPKEQLPKDFKPTGTLTSVGLRTSTSDAGLEFWVPAEAISEVMRWLRF